MRRETESLCPELRNEPNAVDAVDSLKESNGVAVPEAVSQVVNAVEEILASQPPPPILRSYADMPGSRTP